jgi:Na+/proline symporter
VGLAVIAMFAADMAGGADRVVALAVSRDLFHLFPQPTFRDIAFFLGSSVTVMLGSIPQQDVFQRVMSAKSEQAAVRGPIIGGICYFLFAFVPMFIVTSALIVMPEQAAALIHDDPQKVLPTLVLERMPFLMQVLFFGALLSALKSTASATLLAPSVTFVESIWRQFVPRLSDRRELLTMRLTVLGFAICVCGYAIFSQGTSIYDLVSGSYQLPLVGAFWPLVCGLYWKRATTQGAVLSVIFGMGSWLFLLATPAGLHFPPQLAGLLLGGVGMLIGSLAPQALADRRGAHHTLASSEAGT